MPRKVEGLRAQVNEEHTLSSVARAIDSSCNTLVDTFKELSTTEKEAQRLRTQALQSLSMDVKMKGLMDAFSDRAELNNYRKQQSHLDAIQLQAQDRAGATSSPSRLLSLQIASNERSELTMLREENKVLREQKVSADQMRLDSNERAELTMLRRMGVRAFDQVGEVHQAVTGSGASEGIVGFH
ncbi:hypothetical protein KCU71_g4879, partial [Aureobasidium melanogenum]